MKWSLLTLALVCSLAFNIFFLLGAMRSPGAVEEIETPEASETPETPESPALVLNEAQRTVYEQMAAEHNDVRQRLLEEQMLIREELINAFNEPEPDRMRIRGLIDEHVEITHTLQAESARRFKAFLSELSPAQRTHVAKRMRDAAHARPRPLPPALRRFDLDNDGQLNPREAHRARAARRAMGQDRWNELNEQHQDQTRQRRSPADDRDE